MLYTAIVSTNRVLLMDCYVMLEWPMCLAQATKAATSVASLTQKRRVSKWRFTNYNHGTNCDGQRVNVLRILSGGIKTNHPQILPYLHVSIAAYIQHQSLVQSHHMSDKRVYGHLGPKTLGTQDISALCVWCRSVSHFCVGTSAEMSRTVRH